MEKVKATINIRGRVQKAGYRDQIDEAAFDKGLTGYVKNLPDKTVEVVCEGTRSDIEEFIEKIRINKYPINVTEIVVDYSGETGEYTDFEIIREEDLNQAVYERMDMAARYMSEMNSDLGEKIDSGNQMLAEKIDSGNRMLAEKIESSNDKLADKIDSGNKLLAEKIESSNDKLLQKIDSSNQLLAEKTDKGSIKVSDSIKSLDTNMSQKFDHMDYKYDRISNQMEKMDKTLEKLTDAILKLAEKK